MTISGVQRTSRARSEAQRDREMLEWIARFRFVTADVLSERFGISTQSINARLRRLEAAGVIALQRSELTQARAVFVTGRGARQLGLRVRRAPRPDAQRDHELAITRLTAQLENTQPGSARILTEREQRAAEADGQARYSVDVRPSRPGETRRWPDLAVETTAGERIAIEIELTAKAPERLRRIVAGYAAATHYDEVRYLVASAPLAARIAGLAERAQASTLADMLSLRRATIVVAAWHSPSRAPKSSRTPSEC